MPSTGVPGPRALPFIGNLLDFDLEKPVQKLMKIAQEYGPIFKLRGPDGREMIVVSSQELVNELCDQTRFDKKVHRPLQEIREFAGNGLFTADTTDPDWGKAHRILMPVFGPAALRDMFPGMLDIAEQLMLKWERQGPKQSIDVADNMTRLTLDTIGLCAFDTRFNSFYEKQMHPFIGAMVRALAESGARGSRIPGQQRLMEMAGMLRQHHDDIELMHSIADELVSERKKSGDAEGKRDILSVMLNAKDPVTGEGLSEANIRFQLATFLIAGHETTSGLLSFVIYELVKNPDVLARAREEADRVLGTETPRFEHVQQLTYINRVLQETLRIWPTAPAFGIKPIAKQETLAGGKYTITDQDTALVLIPSLHRDPKVWTNPDRFDPDRFIYERAEALPPNSWKPFGNGQRACIGRPFAMQEAALVLAMMLRRFDFEFVDPKYELDVHETLTLKPHNLKIHVKRRDTVVNVPAGVQQPVVKAVVAEPTVTAKTTTESPVASSQQITVAFGSNAGSAEAFAQRIASDATKQGFAPSLGSLDSIVDKLDADKLLVVVTASYEGQPPDNARKFVSWLDGLKPMSLTGVKFAVMGVGNKDWARTYQAIPKKIDAKLEELGATRIMPRGEANARGDFYGDFDAWYSTFWTQVGAAVGRETIASVPSTPSFEVEFVKSVREPLFRQNNLSMGTILANEELVDMSSPMGRSKRHIEIALPEGMTYRTGDYLAVLPLNATEQVDRVLRRFGLDHDAQIVIRAGQDGQTLLPLDQPVAVGELLSSYVELAFPATKAQVEELAAACPCPPEKRALLALIKDQDTYEKSILNKRVSVLDLIERYQSIGLPFVAFLRMLPTLKPRQYSISSSPLWAADKCSLTVAHLSAPARSGEGTYNGVASTYLQHVKVGTKVAVTVRPSQAAFHPPESLEVPIIMVCAGTGLAPFHGFLQDRALKVAAAPEGTKPAPALLFFGCDHPNVDYLYKDELAKWEGQGIVSVRPAFTFAPQGDVKFVQHRLWQDRVEVAELVKQNATFFVCGDGQRMAPAVHQVCLDIFMEATGEPLEQAEAWLESMERQHNRYVADVFA